MHLQALPFCVEEDYTTMIQLLQATLLGVASKLHACELGPRALVIHCCSRNWRPTWPSVNATKSATKMK